MKGLEQWISKFLQFHSLSSTTLGVRLDGDIGKACWTVFGQWHYLEQRPPLYSLGVVFPPSLPCNALYCTVQADSKGWSQRHRSSKAHSTAPVRPPALQSAILQD